MQKILRTERCGDGITVVWEKGGRETTSCFSMTQLIGMQVNARDLLDHPGEWGMDEKTGRIVLVVEGHPSLQPGSGRSFKEGKDHLRELCTRY